MSEKPASAPDQRTSAALSDQEFLVILSTHAAAFVSTGNGMALDEATALWSHSQITQLSHASSLLETFLDNYGASENQTFFPIREKVAVVRWLCMAMASLSHLQLRLPSYRLADEAWARGELSRRMHQAQQDLGEMAIGALRSLRASWESLNLRWGDQLQRTESSPPADARRLPRTRIRPQSGQEAVQAAHPAAAQLASHYLELCQRLEPAMPGRSRSRMALDDLVGGEFGEEFARECESRAHNLQSGYDTDIGESVAAQHPELPRLRGAVSLALHLLEAATALAHLFERRLLHGAYNEPLKSEITALIPQEKLLDTLVNHLYRGAYETLAKGRSEVERLLRAFTRQVSTDLDLPEGVTLHARPISLIVSVVNRHGTPVEMEIQGRRASAMSIMQMLVLSGSNPAARQVRFHGDQAVLEDLRTLFQHRLGEEGLDQLPDRLNYLKPSKEDI